MYPCGWKQQQQNQGKKEWLPKYIPFQCFIRIIFLQVGQGGSGGVVETPEREFLSKNQKEIIIHISPYSWLAQSWVFPLVSEVSATTQFLCHGTQTNRPNI